jgi:hypothetical protein
MEWDALEFARRIVEQELSLYRQSKLSPQHGVLLAHQIFEVMFYRETDPKVQIVTRDQIEQDSLKMELWADVFDEAEHDGYMLVRIKFWKLGTGKRAEAFCSVRKPDWM